MDLLDLRALVADAGMGAVLVNPVPALPPAGWTAPPARVDARVGYGAHAIDSVDYPGTYLCSPADGVDRYRARKTIKGRPETPMHATGVLVQVDLSKVRTAKAPADERLWLL